MAPDPGESDLRTPPAGQGLVCPVCGGALSVFPRWGGAVLQCRAGHAFSPSDFLRERPASAKLSLEELLRLGWEKADRLRRIADHAKVNGRPDLAASLKADLESLEGRNRSLEEALRKFPPPPA